VLFEVWDQAQKDGVNVPKIAFMLPFGPMPNSLVSLRQLYRDVYKPGRYENLWFYWKGKPCIMAYPDNLEDNPEDKKISEFFTFRPGQPDYVDGPQRKDQWAWLENYPQHGYIPTNDNSYEQVAVGVSQNAGPSTEGHCSAFNLPGTYGRSYSYEKGFDPRVDGYLYGWNFQEQWERAFELDPELVFVTGWNEYIAGQWLPEHSWTGDPFSFVDQFDWDRSRDIEPNKGWGDKGDVYYLQLIDNVRKYKGMARPLEVSPSRKIKWKDPQEWSKINPYFPHYKGNVMERDHPGKYDQYYVNKSGRNDIVGARVSRDEEYIHFYVETDNELTTPSGKNWMMLFLDVDRDKSSGWYGYDFVINRLNPENGKAILENNVGNRWEWEVKTEVDIHIDKDFLVVRIPKKLLGIDNDRIDIEFKWNDNMQENGNIMDFYVNGDTAPGGRFNYIYTTLK